MAVAWQVLDPDEGDYDAVDVHTATTDGLLALVRAVQARRPAWHADGRCQEYDPRIWFPTRQVPSTPTAKALCEQCLVRAECLAEALEDPDLDGVRGGTTPRERAEMRSK